MALPYKNEGPRIILSNQIFGGCQSIKHLR